MEKRYHRHIGIYGVCKRQKSLLVINKNRGPYSGRYDMPGGSIEPNETMLGTIIREFKEETGLVVQVKGQIGSKDIIIPWTRAGYEHTHCHHIFVLYEVEYIAGHINSSPNIEDSSGAVWIDTAELNEDNSSPIVMATKEWIETSRFNIEPVEYTDWIIKE